MLLAKTNHHAARLKNWRNRRSRRLLAVPAACSALGTDHMGSTDRRLRKKDTQNLFESVVVVFVLVTCSTVCMSTAVNAMQQSPRLIELITCVMSSYTPLIIMRSASHVQLVRIPDVNACMGNNQRHRLSTLLQSA